ncbi:MAG: glycosyltransferase family 39 protein [Anaerolineae bacterium]
MGIAVKRWQSALLLVILLLAAALRFYHLGTQSLWNDEGTTVALVQRDIPTIFRNAAADIHPPLYYLLLHYWVKATGTSEFAVRSFSVLAGIALVLVIYELGRRLLGMSAAVTAAAFAAMAPLQVYYSQETRMYMWAALLGALSWLIFLKLGQVNSPHALKQWKWGTAVLLLFTSAAAVYSHYLVFAVIFAQSIVVLILWLCQGNPRSWNWLLRWIGLQALLVAAYIPWLLVSWRSLVDWPAVGEALSAWQLFVRAGTVFTFGVTMPLRSLPMAIGAALLAAAIVIPLATKQRQWILAAYLLVPLALFLGLSLSRPLYKDKFMLLMHPAFLLLTAYAVVRAGDYVWQLLRKRWADSGLQALLTGVVLTASFISLAHLYYDPAFQRDDYRGICAEIERTAGANDVVLINAPSQIETVGYYCHGPQELVPLPLSRPLDKNTVQTQLERLVSKHQRIYGIFWATIESDPDRFIETWLDQHTYKAADRWFGALRLVMYAVPTTVPLEPGVLTHTTFNDLIALDGFTLSTPVVHPGDIVQLALYWRAFAAVPERYKVFVHLVDDKGEIVAQRDSEPGGGVALTKDWEPGYSLIDKYGILLPADAPTGTLTIRIGLYRLDGGQRLNISEDGQVLGDYIDLGQLRVQP